MEVLLTWLNLIGFAAVVFCAIKAGQELKRTYEQWLARRHRLEKGWE
jgi:hypothetical protein